MGLFKRRAVTEMGFVLEDDPEGRTLVVTGDWTDRAAAALSDGVADGLVLNYARGYREPMSVGRTRERTYLGARYARLVPRLGKQKTIVAVEHSILTAVWHMLTDNVDYQDLGGDYFTKQDPERTMRRIMRQANALGLTVRFDPIPDVA